MSYREDFFRMLEGKTPVSDVPFYMIGAYESEIPNGYVGVMPDISDFGRMMETRKNSWGIEYEEDIYGTGFMPRPGHFILKDVTKWKDIVKAPYRYDYDFKAAAERDLAVQTWDKETQVSNIFGLGGDYFLRLSGFMGFEGAMFAMYDEPDALHELLDYFCDFDCWMTENILNYYDIDVAGFGDDNATEINPFISYDMFKEFLYPRYKRLFKVAKDHGKIISYHNCGRCEDFMDDFVEIGAQVWNCATTMNDLNAFKAKHDNKIILETLPRIYPDDSEEKIRQIVRATIDTYAPGGAFVYIGSVGAMNPEQRERADNIAYDEAIKYGKGFYA
ncbi:MAG: hypothetical protein LBU61_04680 [Coriobacteriales bacterium]|nr:hypothetical protein [Coriobacteriales bacterium]